MESGFKDHTFGTINVKNHCLEDELTLGKSRLLDVDSRVE